MCDDWIFGINMGIHPDTQKVIKKALCCIACAVKR